MTESSKFTDPIFQELSQDLFNSFVKSEGLPRARRIFENKARDYFHAEKPGVETKVDIRSLNEHIVKLIHGVPETPANYWSEEGKVDPHKGHYEGTRLSLGLGWLTDDELANGAFMHYNDPLDVQGIMAGTAISPISWMTATKDRIRWLSRKLMKAESNQAILLRALEDNVQIEKQENGLVYVVKAFASDSHGMPTLDWDTVFTTSTTDPVEALRSYYNEADKTKSK